MTPEARILELETKLAAMIDLVKGRRKNQSMFKIALQEATIGGITVAQMKGRGKGRMYSYPRMRAYARMIDAGYTSIQVGAYFGGRDHSTVLQGAARARAGLL